MDYALVNLGVTIALLIATFAFRKRIWRALGRLLLAGAIEFARREFFEEGEEDAPDGSKRPTVRLKPRGEAFLSGMMTAVIAWAKKNVKLTLPGMGGIPGVGTPSVGQAAGLMLSGPIKDFLPKDIKSFAPQIGMAIGERIGPMLEGLFSGLQGAGTGTKPAPGKNAPVPKELEL